MSAPVCPAFAKLRDGGRTAADSELRLAGLSSGVLQRNCRLDSYGSLPFARGGQPLGLCSLTIVVVRIEIPLDGRRAGSQTASS